VIALQEVCLNQPEQLLLFLRVMQGGEREAYHYSDYAETRRGKPCEKGQATITRFPIQRAGTIQLSRVGAQRSAIWLDAVLDDGRVLRVYNLHLSNRAGRRMAPIDGRLRQVGRVLEHAASHHRLHPKAPTLLLGDFNSLSSLVDPWRHEVALQQVKHAFSASIEHFSPTMVLPYQVDWIFYRGLQLQRSQPVRIFHSDHFPVMADFGLGARG
jgi:endonuclease/exonuclease/phosphatase (EEP) superfamily protein YafD